MAEGQDGSGRMLSSDELREHLSAYLDGQLSGDLVEQMEQTLQKDEELRAELESLRDLVDALGSFPEVVAPEGFTAGVISRVEDLAIPSPRDLEEVGSSEFDQDLEPLSVPLWLKGSIAASLAATLLLGYLVVRAPLMTSHPELASVERVADSSVSWGAPLATGFDESADLDASAGLDLAAGEPAQEDLPGDDFAAPEPAPKAPAPRRKQVSKKGGGTGDGVVVRKSAEQKRRRRPSGLKEVAGDLDLSGGVYEAEHEEDAPRAAEVSAEVETSAADGVVALDAAEAPADERAELDTHPHLPDLEASSKASPGRLFQRGAPAGRADINEEKPETSGSNLDSDSSAVQFRGGLRRSGSGQSGGRLGRSGSGRSRPPAVSSSSRESGAGHVESERSEPVAVVSEETGEVPADAPSIAAKVVIGNLVVASPGVISTLVGEIRTKGWSLQNLTPATEPGTPLPASGTQILQIMVPEGSEEDLTRLLGGYGALNTDRTLSSAHDGNARLRLTIRWGN